MDTVHARGALVGGWRLVSWENRAADGQITYPMGIDALGALLYTADGRFSVTISRPGRAGFAAGDLLSGTTEEQARPWRALSPTRAATASLVTASSTMWRCRWFPNWVGSDQERWVELAKNRLILSASPLLLAGKLQVPRLVWERVDPSAGAG
jgi:hypothetical protein